MEQTNRIATGKRPSKIGYSAYRGYKGALKNLANYSQEQSVNSPSEIFIEFIYYNGSDYIQ